MDQNRSLLAIGAPLVDILVFVEEGYLEQHQLAKGSNEPVTRERLDELVRAAPVQGRRRSPGGSGANVLRGLAHLGWSCTFHGQVGEDQLAQELLADYRASSIEPLLIPSSLPTGAVLCCITPDGERTMRHYPGASGAFSPDNISPAAFVGKRLLHLEGYNLYNEGVIEEAIRLARTEGLLTSFDLANFALVEEYHSTIEALLELELELVFANEEEARRLTGLEAASSALWLARRSLCAIVTCAEKGAYIALRGDTSALHVGAFVVDHPLDATGAGDLFTSGFLDGYLRAISIERAARQGALLAAAVVQQQGAELPQEKWSELLDQLRLL